MNVWQKSACRPARCRRCLNLLTSTRADEKLDARARHSGPQHVDLERASGIKQVPGIMRNRCGPECRAPSETATRTYPCLPPRSPRWNYYPSFIFMRLIFAALTLIVGTGVAADLPVVPADPIAKKKEL